MLTLRLIRLTGAPCGFMLFQSCGIASPERISRAPAAWSRYRPAWRRRLGGEPSEAESVKRNAADVLPTEESGKLLALLIKSLASFDELVLGEGKAVGR